MTVPTLISEYRSKRDEEYFIHYVRLQLDDIRVDCTFEQGELVMQSLRGWVQTETPFSNQLTGFHYVEVGHPIFSSLFHQAPDELGLLYVKDEFIRNHLNLNKQVIPILYAYYYSIIIF
jgi:hypothetical protein